jgi:nitrite reductase (NAD(P)H)
VVGPDLATSQTDIYAVGECASWENQTFGLIAPGVEMADVLAFNLTQAKAHAPRKFKAPDLSTKLKLLGVEVASFGDFFADRDGPKNMPGRQRAEKKETNGATPRDRVKNLTDGPAPPPVKALTYKDPFQQVYKKYLFTMDGKYLLGGMMIGDTKDYIKLVPLVKNQKQLEMAPSELIVGAQKGDDDGSDLSGDTQICSCHNVTKDDVVNATKDGTCKSIGDVKSCTKAGTGCGGCMPLVQTIFNKTMASMGNEVKNHLCPHFEYSRADLFNIIYVKGLKDFAAVMETLSLRCTTNIYWRSTTEVCKIRTTDSWPTSSGTARSPSFPEFLAVRLPQKSSSLSVPLRRSTTSTPRLRAVSVSICLVRGNKTSLIFGKNSLMVEWSRVTHTPSH